MEELLTVKEAAGIVKVNETTIRRWIKEDKLKAKRLGPKLLRIPASELAAFLSARAEGENSAENPIS